MFTDFLKITGLLLFAWYIPAITFMGHCFLGSTFRHPKARAISMGAGVSIGLGIMVLFMNAAIYVGSFRVYTVLFASLVMVSNVILTRFTLVATLAAWDGFFDHPQPEDFTRVQ